MYMVSSSAFTVWRGWMDDLLASTRTQVESAAIRHAKMVGASITSTLIWVRTGSSGVESGVLTTMEHSGTTHVSSGVQEFVTFFEKLPESTRQEIVEALHPASGNVL